MRCSLHCTWTWGSIRHTSSGPLRKRRSLVPTDAFQMAMRRLRGRCHTASCSSLRCNWHSNSSQRSRCPISPYCKEDTRHFPHQQHKRPRLWCGCRIHPSSTRPCMSSACKPHRPDQRASIHDRRSPYGICHITNRRTILMASTMHNRRQLYSHGERRRNLHSTHHCH